MSANQEFPDAAQPNSKTPAARKWDSLRKRVLLLIPLALLVAAGIIVPRQMRQHRAIAALQQYQAVIRTQPASLLGAELLIPPEYADEIIEVYWRDPELDEQQLAVLSGIYSLEKLELSGSKVSSAGLPHLRNLTRLYMLHLDGTQVGDEGLANLARLRGLGVLSLDHTR